MNIQCYNCSGEGHIARNCLKPRRPMQCSHCGSNSHTRSKCPDGAETARQQSRPPQRSNAAMCAMTPITRQVINPFSKIVLLNGITADGLIDSGCSNVLVRKSIAIQSGLQIEVKNCPLYTVGDRDHPGTTTVGVSKGTVSVDDVIATEHEVLVVPDEVIPVDILVGRTWLELPHIIYYYSYKQGDKFVIESLTQSVPSDSVSTVRPEEITVLNVSTISDVNNRQPIVEEDIDMGGSITQDQKRQLLTLVNKYRDVFAKNLNELGCTHMLEMDIQEIPGSAPVSCRPYKTSPTDRDTINQILLEWEQNGIISESKSAYASPVLLVDKQSGEKRLCIDYRRLNKQTQDHPYPMPNLDDELSGLSEGKIFTTLDLSNGYLQIPLSEQAKEKTSFVTQEHIMKFERMPFGLKTAPATFWKLMYKVFKDLKHKGIVNYYLDDIIITATDWENMMERLKLVFDALRAARLTLKPSKCVFGSIQLDFLGFTISEGQLRPGRKIEAIATYPEPRNVHEIRRFLGLAGFFRRFIEKYAILAEPLTRLTKKDVPFLWQEEQMSAFKKLKVHLTSEPVLKMFNSNASVTQLHTDASQKRLAGILLQGDEEKELHMVYCVSKKTTGPEQHYHSSLLELLAIVWSVERLRSYLLGRHFTVITDCQALMYLNLNKNTKPQVARWYETLQEFTFDVRYRPGTQMGHVDVISRLSPNKSEEQQTVEESCAKRLEVYTVMTLCERVNYLQQGDEEIKRLIQILNNPEGRSKYELGFDNKLQDF